MSLPTGRVAVLDADVMLSFNCPMHLVGAFLVDRCWGHSDWKCPTCLHPLHRFTAAVHREVVWAGLPQLGHLDGAWSVFCGEATAFDCDFCRLYVDLTTWTPRGEDMPSFFCLATSSARQRRIAPSKVRYACTKSLCRVLSSSTLMTTLARKISSLILQCLRAVGHILGLQVWHTDMSKKIAGVKQSTQRIEKRIKRFSWLLHPVVKVDPIQERVSVTTDISLQRGDHVRDICNGRNSNYPLTDVPSNVLVERLTNRADSRLPVLVCQMLAIDVVCPSILPGHEVCRGGRWHQHWTHRWHRSSAWGRRDLHWLRMTVSGRLESGFKHTGQLDLPLFGSLHLCFHQLD